MKSMESLKRKISYPHASCVIERERRRKMTEDSTFERNEINSFDENESKRGFIIVVINQNEDEI